MSNITDQELALLRACQDADQWNLVCQAIKNNHGGDYPSDWWIKVLVSGLVKDVSASWNQPDAFDLKVQILSSDALEDE